MAQDACLAGQGFAVMGARAKSLHNQYRGASRLRVHLGPACAMNGPYVYPFSSWSCSTDHIASTAFIPFHHGGEIMMQDPGRLTDSQGEGVLILGGDSCALV